MLAGGNRESEAQYWSSVPDPNQIEREQAEALRMARYATNPSQQNRTTNMETDPQSYLTNYTETSMATTSHVLQTVFVSDDEAEANEGSAENQTECVVTPVETGEPLNPMYTQPTTRRYDDLDVQPSRGPRDPVNTTGDIMDNYFEENLTDVLKIS